MIVNKDINKLSTNKTVQKGRVGNVAYMFKLLGQIYVDKFNAIPREFISNAYDARIKAGTHDTPIVLSFNENPHNEHYTFAVRDYGSGMSPDLINNIYLGLGESEKNTSDEFTGGFGVGSKSFISYSEDTILNIETTYEGILYKYIAMINDDGFNLILNEEIETDEINGTLVYFEVLNKFDLDKFYRHSLFYSRFLDNIIIESNLSYKYLGTYKEAKINTFNKYGKGLLVSNKAFSNQLDMDYYESPNFKTDNNYINILINNVTYPVALLTIIDLLAENDIYFDFNKLYNLCNSYFIFKVPNELIQFVKPQVNRSSVEIEEELALAIYDDFKSLYDTITKANDSYLVNNGLDQNSLVFDNYKEFQKYFISNRNVIDKLLTVNPDKLINHSINSNGESFSLSVSFSSVIDKFNDSFINIGNECYTVNNLLGIIDSMSEYIINQFTNTKFRKITTKNNKFSLNSIDVNNNYSLQRKLQSRLYEYGKSIHYLIDDYSYLDLSIGFYNSRLLTKYLPFIHSQFNIQYIIKYDLNDDIIDIFSNLHKRSLFRKLLNNYNKNIIVHILNWFNDLIKETINNKPKPTNLINASSFINLNNVADLIPKDDLIEGIKLYTISTYVNDSRKLKEDSIRLSFLEEKDYLNYKIVYYDRRNEKQLALSNILFQIIKEQKLKIKLVSSNLKDYEYIKDHFNSNNINNIKFMSLKEFTNGNAWKSILTKYYCLKVRRDYHLRNNRFINDLNIDKSITTVKKENFLKQEFNYTVGNYPNQANTRFNKKGVIDLDIFAGYNYSNNNKNPYVLGINNDFKYQDKVIYNSKGYLTNYNILYYLDPELNNHISEFTTKYESYNFIQDNALEDLLLRILNLIKDAKKEDKTKLIYKYFKVNEFEKAQNYIKAVSFLNYFDINNELSSSVHECLYGFFVESKYVNSDQINLDKKNVIKHYLNSLKNYYISNKIINPCLNYYVRRFDNNDQIATKYLVQELEFKFKSRKSRKSIKLVDLLQD